MSGWTRNRPSGFLAQTVLYAIVGGVCSLLDWSIFVTLHHGMTVHYAAAAASSLIIATMVNYRLSARYVFAPGRHSRSREILLTYTVSTVGLGLNVALVVVFVETAGLTPLAAKVTATCIGFAWSYFGRRRFVFAPTPEAAPIRARVS